MTREDIIRMAREAGYQPLNRADFANSLEEAFFVRFANLVAAAEREACARVCDETRYKGYCPPEDGAAPEYYDAAAESCADAIRARGEK